MSESTHPIRLVVGIEIRPPVPGAEFVFDRDAAERIGRALADDLARCVPEVTETRLVTGPALLEPGQVLSPDHSPWSAMQTVAEGQAPQAGGSSSGAVDPGLVTLGSVNRRLSHEALGPYRTPPDGLFLCLPILVDAPAPRRETFETAFERTLFDEGGIHPPALAEMAEATRLEPVHGQLMTLTDLAALVKMQLAGAGLDPFWPPVEHALLAASEAADLELPAGLRARWNVEARGWELMLEEPADPPDEDDALWLRSFRQTAALLETHLIPWRAALGERDDDGAGESKAELDEESRWVIFDRGADDGVPGFRTLEHQELGLIGYETVEQGRRRLALPLVPEAIDLLIRDLGGS